MAEGKVLSSQQLIIENQKALSKVPANQKKILALLAR
jgi:hypothetical protein